MTRMTRYISVTLELRNVRCIANVLVRKAPRTAKAVWDALPLSRQVFHGKSARNEICNLVPAFAPDEPGKENITVIPIPGDLCYSAFDANDLATPSQATGRTRVPRNSTASSTWPSSTGGAIR